MIKVEHLRKCYGSFVAVDDLSFEIEEGHVYGFLGPNGAGKSTTMNIMTGCLSATSGHVTIDGYDIFDSPREAKRRIGYLPEQPPLYPHETPLEYLRFVGQAKGLRGSVLTAQIAQVVEQTGLGSVRYQRISTLSKGYRQRLGIAQALLGNPRVIILDEPTVGLDPIQIVEIRDLIQSLGQQHTVLLSSHILSEVQAICEKILILHHGKLIAFDTPDNLEQQLLSPGEITLVAEASVEQTREILAPLEHITQLDADDCGAGLCRAHLTTDLTDIHPLSRTIFFAFAQQQRPLLEMTLKKASLEDIFLELTEQQDAQLQQAQQSQEQEAKEA